MSITILNPGTLTSVQDLGRIGYQQYGVSVSGVMDPRSASIANILVDNDEGEAVLECTMMGPHLRFDAPNIIAITGGDLGATLDGQSIDTYRAVPVNAGQTLRFTMLRTGCRAFVAFAGGLDIPVVMGSRSTDMKAKIGGYQGRKLQKDDVIAFRAPKTDLKNLGVRHISPEFVPRAEYKLRVVLGPQDDAFTELGAMTFLSSVYTLTPEFDRMGCRLDGEPIEHIKDGNIISDGQFFNGYAMSRTEVQSFLDEHGGDCTGTGCLKNRTFDTTDQPDDRYCDGYDGAKGETAATIIDKSSRSCGISQKVLLTVLQKEQQLVTASKPTDFQFKAAMGLSCPDDNDCDPQYAGFFRQVGNGMGCHCLKVFFFKLYLHD